MPQALIPLLVLLAIGLAIAVVALWLRLSAVTRREALQALAARRGWALNLTEGKLGRPAALRLQPRGGSGWQVTARRESAPGIALRPKSEATDYEAPDPDWPDGLLVIGPTLPLGGGLPETPTSPTTLDGPVGQAILARLLGADHVRLGPDLQPFAGPVGLVVVATTDPTHRIDLAEVGKLYLAYGEREPDPACWPAMMLGADGFSLRLRHEVKRADKMEAFIDFAQDLSRILSAP
jgi:hypothetical protein